VSFPDVPGVHTFGADRDEALARAVDALETMFMGMIADREDIPLPAAAKGRHFVELPALTEAKILLYRAMRALGIGKAEVARRLGWHMPQVDRLLDLRHASRLDQLERAFRVLGKQLAIQIREAAWRTPLAHERAAQRCRRDSGWRRVLDRPWHCLPLDVKREAVYRCGLIRSFRSTETERVFRREFSRRFQALARVAKRKLDHLHAATSLADLAAAPGNHLEPLAGQRAGQHSIRINDQWRICFVWKNLDAFEVEIVDYH
jgi:antitoxin HicB